MTLSNCATELYDVLQRAAMERHFVHLESTEPPPLLAFGPMTFRYSSVTEEVPVVPCEQTCETAL